LAHSAHPVHPLKVLGRVEGRLAPQSLEGADMRISLANVSKSISATEFKTAVHAIERQVHEDFAPIWGMDASLRVIRIDRNAKPNPEAELSDVIIYVGELGDDPQAVEGAVGYHSANLGGIPYGFVFADVAKQLGETWTVTLSHEVLELVADPEVNLLVMAPHPKKKRSFVLRPYEVCDPVQGDIYTIDDVEVSNFVLPLYFAEEAHPTQKQTNHMAFALDRFGLRPQGYYSYLDLELGKYVDVFGEKVDGARVSQIKSRLQTARRQARRATSVAGLLGSRVS
jgi:hypothetical protein